MDVVTVGHINICINEAECLKMKNLVYFNGIWYTLNNQDIYFDKQINYNNGEKRRGVTRFPLYIIFENMTPLIFQFYGFFLRVN